MSVFPQLVNLTNNDIIHINSDKFSVGRSLANDYILNSAYASRVQFVLENKEGVWSVQDKSTNGTRINDLQVKNGETLPLENGDLLKFQNIVLKFLTSAEEEPSLDNSVEIVSEESPPENSGNNSGCQISDTPVCGQKRARDNVPEETTQKKNKLTSDKKDNSMEEELHCAICSELFVKAVTLGCCHTFCSFCINHWKAKHPHCPICRKSITAMAPTLVLDNYIEKLVDRMDEETKEQRKEIIQQRSEQEKTTTTTRQATNTVYISNPIVVSSDEEISDDEGYDYEEIVAYTGYYGGYGRCYRCNARGHWANHCPFR